ncbi:MAG: class I SAM-dependent methyltransferase [Solirubrobacterales bacterium]
MSALAERNIVARWDDAHRYSPAPRHRRRLIARALRDLGAAEVLDAGCGQPFLLAELRARLGVPCYGCDVSEAVIDDPAWQGVAEELRVVDLERESWPDGRTFDAVVCSEVLEHVPDWRAALANVVAMARRYVVITVPGGKRRRMDALVGHHRHFVPGQIAAALREEGCDPVWGHRWGWPVHSLYRWGISRAGADRMYRSFGTERYSSAQIGLSNVLYGAFFVNDVFHRGDQLMVLGAKR